MENSPRLREKPHLHSLKGATVGDVVHSINYYEDHPIINLKNNFLVEVCDERRLSFNYVIRVDDYFMSRLDSARELFNADLCDEGFYDIPDEYLAKLELPFKEFIAQVMGIRPNEVQLTVSADSLVEGEEFDKNNTAIFIEFFFNIENIYDLLYLDVINALRPLAHGFIDMNAEGEHFKILESAFDSDESETDVRTVFDQWLISQLP